MKICMRKELSNQTYQILCNFDFCSSRRGAKRPLNVFLLRANSVLITLVGNGFSVWTVNTMIFTSGLKRRIFFVASKIWSARSSSLYIFVSLSMHACCRRKKIANRLKVGRAPRKRVLDLHFPIVSVHVGVVSQHPVGHFFEIRRWLSIDEGTNLGIGGWEEKPTCIGQSERGIGR